jgi:hypothetical protein
MFFDESKEIVIRDVLDEIDEKKDGNISREIHEALYKTFLERWSIVVYSSFDKEKGFGTFFHWRNKIRIYRVLYIGQINQ